MSNSFVHLHLHSEYSIKDSVIRIQSLISKTVDLGMQSVAITDIMNLFGAIKFYKAAIAAHIKPIFGCDIYLENIKDSKTPFQAVLLCQNEEGYKNLIKLISRAYIENQQNGIPIIKRNWLYECSKGLIALSGGVKGDIGQALIRGRDNDALEYLKEWMMLFPDRFYLELQRAGRKSEDLYISGVLELAKSYQVPVVATNDVMFLKEEDFEAHEARVCINSGYLLSDPNRPHLYSDQQYFRSEEEMIELFKDIPEAIYNSFEILKRCNLMLDLDKVFMPEFSMVENIKVDDYFEKKAKEGLKESLSFLLNENSDDYIEKRKIYEKRLKLEIDVIKKMGFSGYFLIVSDFVCWAKDNNIAVCPGRGSGAGSLVAYVLKIIDFDPLRYDLLFERFLNIERVSLPDFDIDFCMEGRDEVVEYVTKKYGKECVSQIITYGTMAAKGVVRDVGRVLGYGYGYVDKIAKLVPFELKMTLVKALEQEALLKERYEQEPEVRTLIDLAQKLEGLTRNVGKHACGVVIAPSKLTDFTPLYCEENGENLVTQFDMDDVASVGLVKFDFLGLRTLTIINWTLDAINKKLKNKGEPPLNLSLIDTNDDAVFELFRNCQTTAVFQSESRVMKDLIRKLQPDCFEDIVALVALIRPGPSSQIDDFINRKHGRIKLEYVHPKLEPILKTTYGIMLYQEQVMKIAQVLANYTLGEADLLRRAMGKKKPKEMAKQRKVFVKGALKNGVSDSLANYIFDLMEKFAGYGFNKSHSVGYGLISYQTAWLKVHYPMEYMSAVLSSDMDNTDKLFNFLEDCKMMKLQILPPNINESEYKFVASESKNGIVYGLGAIKGVGFSAVNIIINERKSRGVFKDLFDFCGRVDLRKVNKRVLEALIKSGAMDCLGVHRASLLATLNNAMLSAEKISANILYGQRDLFDNVFDDENYDNCKYTETDEWTYSQRLQFEKETLGYYLSGHPIVQYKNELKNIVPTNFENLSFMNGQMIRVAGLVIGLRVRSTRRNARVAFITIDDLDGRFEIAVFADAYVKYRDLLQKDKLLIVEGDVNLDEYTSKYRINAKKIMDINQAREFYAKYISIEIDAVQVTHDFVERLSEILKPYLGGSCPLCILYKINDVQAMLPFGSSWNVNPCDNLIWELKKSFSVKIVY